MYGFISNTTFIKLNTDISQNITYITVQLITLIDYDFHSNEIYFANCNFRIIKNKGYSQINNS